MKTGRWYNAQRLAALASALLLLVLLAAWVLLPSPTAFQAQALRLLVALLASFVAFSLPGSLAVSLESTQLLLVRAAGALAVFSLCYFFLPAAIP